MENTKFQIVQLALVPKNSVRGTKRLQNVCYVQCKKIKLFMYRDRSAPLFCATIFIFYFFSYKKITGNIMPTFLTVSDIHLKCFVQSAKCSVNFTKKRTIYMNHMIFNSFSDDSSWIITIRDVKWSNEMTLICGCVGYYVTKLINIEEEMWMRFYYFLFHSIHCEL